MRVGPRARHAGVRDRPRSPVDDRVRGRRRGGRHLERAWGSPPERLVRRGKADNYWWTHAAGPAGPSSEIFVDRGSRYGPDGGPEVDEDRFCEIWNHVFMQHRVDGACEVLGDLPEQEHRHRLVGRARRHGVAGQGELLRDRPVRPAARGGAVPVGQASTAPTSSTTSRSGSSASTRGRRRSWWPTGSSRRTRVAGTSFGGCCAAWSRHRGVWAPSARSSARSWRGVVEGFGDAYPELRENRAFIEEVLASEEDRFSATLRQGMVLFDEARDRAPTGWSRATTRSSCPTRSGSRSS